MAISKKHLLAFSWFVCVTVGNSYAQTLPAATAKKIDSLFKQWDNTKSPGCAIGIVRNDSLIYAKGYGTANLEYGVPITSKTIFEMGSVSKQFTAYTILLLAHQGQLSLNDDIHKYLPWLPNFEKKITISNLLYHISGIRDYDQLLSIAGTTQEDVITREHVIKILSKQRTLNFDPGAQYMYSNSGYFLLGEIVRSVTGKSLRQFTDSAVFKPLGMNNTHFHDDYTGIVPNRAYPYMQANKAGIVNSSAVGAKGLFTNIDDMSKWAINFLNSKSDSHLIIEQMMQPGKLNNGKETIYGAGIYTSESDFDALRMYGHDGFDGGYLNSVRYLPGAKMAVLIFSNGGSGRVVKMTELLRLFIKSKPQVKTRAQGNTGAFIRLRGDSIITDPASAKPLAGSYLVDDGGHAEFKLKDKKFYYVSYGRNYLLLRTARDSFYFPGDSTSVKFDDHRMKFTFTRKSDGTITVRLTWPDVGSGATMIKTDANSKLSDKQLLAYTGRYYCRELDCSYTIILKDHQLILTNAKYNDSPITFYDKDRLLNGLWFIHTLIITRNKKEKITGFEVNCGVIQDLRFEKVN